MRGVTLLELNEVTIPYKTGEPVRICGLGDIHWGNIAVDEQALDRAVKFICDNHVYVVGMGDMIDSINPDDKRFDIKTVRPDFRANLDNLISEQYESLCEKLSKIPQEQWIGIHTGNHEEVIRTKYYRDVTRDLCRTLKTTYLGYEAWSRIRFERGSINKHVEVFKLFSTHGSGGARFDPTKQWKMEHLTNKINADLIMMGHVHSIQVGRGLKGDITSSGKLKELNKTYGWMLTGTFLNKSTEGVISYAERFNLPPSKTGIATFQIFPEERRIHVSC